MPDLPKATWDWLMEDKERRKFACENNFFLFSVYYFTNYHFYETPPFHLDMYEDLTFKDWRFVLWVMFRESAKTSIAKMKLVHNIVYEKKHFNVWVSFDQSKAEANLFDVALILQTNPRIIDDFGQLYFEEKIANQGQKSTKKSLEEFITSNGIKVKAYSTGMSTRGEVFGEYRPDAYFIDDIETTKTITSDARTQQVKGFLDELFSGVATDAEVLIMGNKLINDGSIAYLEEKADRNHNWRYRNVPVIKEGQLMWPDKFVKTDLEAAAINATIEDPKYRKVSLESKKRDLGIVIYDREMMNKPLSDETREVKARWLENRFELDELKFKHRNRFVTIDSAQGAEMKRKGKSNDPDPVGITVVDIDFDNNWYVVYARKMYLNAPQLIDQIFWLWETFKPVKMGVEKLSFDYQVKPYLLIKSNETGIYPIVEELRHGGKNKEDRIRGALMGRLANNKIWFLKDATDDTDGEDGLRQQLYDFPVAKHDDISDALAYIDQIGFRPFSGGSPEGNVPTTLAQEMAAYKKEVMGSTPRGALHDLM